jgi:hypothetical protein
MCLEWLVLWVILFFVMLERSEASPSSAGDPSLRSGRLLCAEVNPPYLPLPMCPAFSFLEISGRNYDVWLFRYKGNSWLPDHMT